MICLKDYLIKVLSYIIFGCNPKISINFRCKAHSLKSVLLYCINVFGNKFFSLGIVTA